MREIKHLPDNAANPVDADAKLYIYNASLVELGDTVKFRGEYFKIALKTTEEWIDEQGYRVVNVYYTGEYPVEPDTD